MYEVFLRNVKEINMDVCVCKYWLEPESATKSSDYTEVLYSGKDSLVALIHGKVENYI